MFEFLGASLTPDTDVYCAAICTADVATDPPATASSLEVRIPKDMLMIRSRICPLADTSLLMGRNRQTCTLRWKETAAWDNYHHLLLQLHTIWVIWVMSDFYHRLPL